MSTKLVENWSSFGSLAKTMIECSGVRWFILHQKAPKASCSSFNKIYLLHKIFALKVFWMYYRETGREADIYAHIFCDCIVHTYFLQQFHELPIKLPFHMKRGRNCVQADNIILEYSYRACVCRCIILNISFLNVCRVPFYESSSTLMFDARYL